ncbi:pectin methyl esterase [Mycena albidolilacea]|uniref:Pectinesterase n=1 Tax=Mycena albidolilacea TaxID=1033008 RepID=A0AAD7AST2_9AGAR|nr:pectin methyl esterase [Mycena albidolilacea]
MLRTALLCLLSIPAALGVSRTAPPAGAIVVRQTGATAGQFTTISAAMASLSGTAPATVFIFPGTYTEQVVIAHPNLTIMGSTTDTGSYKQNTVTITNNLNAQDAGSDDMSATVRATKPASNLRIYNVNIANTYGVGRQAVALSAKGTRQGFYGLSITGYQDTLYADVTGVQYYSNCYIQGAVDYIFGAASAWFGECTLASNGGGAITANSRDSTTDTSYYVIDSSTITSAPGAPSLVGKVYLGRPWRMYARVVFQNSVLPNLINPIGYTTLAAGATPIYSEIGNTGAGASTSQRVTYTPISAPLTHAQVLGADYATWIDGSF